jgi:hypothetical protein
MRPDTVHAVAQLIRHTRGLLTTIEKWVAATPPEELPGEVEAVNEWISLLRGALTELSTTLGSPRPSAAPSSAPTMDQPR